jgi:hypothetical protein
MTKTKSIVTAPNAKTIQSPGRVKKPMTLRGKVGPAQPKSTRSAGAKSEKRTSALDAAAIVLKKKGKPMNCGELVAEMAKLGLWSSPSGKTPAATLHSAMLREITKKGRDSRFKKVDRGMYAFNKA